MCTTISTCCSLFLCSNHVGWQHCQLCLLIYPIRYFNRAFENTLSLVHRLALYLQLIASPGSQNLPTRPASCHDSNCKAANLLTAFRLNTRKACIHINPLDRVFPVSLFPTAVEASFGLFHACREPSDVLASVHFVFGRAPAAYCVYLFHVESIRT